MVNAVGESVDKGARWGLGGAILGGLASVGIVGGAGYGIYSLAAAWSAGAVTTGALVGYGALGLAGLVATAAIATPIVLTLGGAGALLGVLSGAKHAGRENARQQAANNYQAGYDQTVANFKAQMMQAAQAQQQAPAYNPGVQVSDNAGVRVMNEAPEMQAANYNEASSQISAASIDNHAQLAETPSKQATV